MRRRWLLLLPFGVLAAGVAAALPVVGWLGDRDQPPEGATGRRKTALTRSEGGLVAAAHPLAAEAGRSILAAGGSAADAAVAVQAMLTLVEPQSSGIGGGAFLLHHEASTGRLTAHDGRETAPEAAGPDLFLTEDGKPEAFFEALVGGRSVGVPGALRMLEEVHRFYGRLPWDQLFAPAIRAARDGFEVTPRLHRLLAADPALRAMPAARRLYFTAEGQALPVGTKLENPELADVLERVAREGADALHEGEIADAIVAAVRSATRPSAFVLGVNRWLGSQGFARDLGLLASEPASGLLSAEDLRSYEPKMRPPVCLEYRDFRVCGHPPPTSGGLVALQILGILSHFDVASLDPEGPDFAHLLVEAGRLAFADRDSFVADPDFVDVPVAGLLDPDYLAGRARLIDPERALERPRPGAPPGARGARTPDRSSGLPSTSHLSIVDREGNVVSMTTSVENVFGSRLLVRGFLLNNQLTDFAFVPERDGRPVANAVAPGKRPRSSMSPLIVYERASGRPVLAIGSPGGSRIIGYTVRATVAVLDHGLDVAAALELPHVIGRYHAELEDEGWAPGQLERVKEGLDRRGHRVDVGPLNSGLHAIALHPDRREGGVDPRREGAALAAP